jgi:hypothetical protein
VAQARRHTTIKAIWGPLTLNDGSSALPVYKRLGVDVLQVQLQWQQIAVARPGDPSNPGDPAYHWPRSLDAAVAALRGKHLKLALMVKNTPAWANGGMPSNYAPSDVNDYAAFAKAAARRYRSVKLWMIWGEPQRVGTFEPFDPASPDGPRRYARMLDASYAALKSVRRSIVVIGGMTLTNDSMTPVRFLHWMKLPNGKPPRLDWFGHNPFAIRFPDIRQGIYYKGVRDISDSDTYIREIRHVYARIHRRPKLWLSEFTVQSDRSSSALKFFVSRSEQARWVGAAYRLATRSPYIAGLGWFNLQDQSAPDGLTTGLLDPAGYPKPAFYAYKRVP